MTPLDEKVKRCHEALHDYEHSDPETNARHLAGLHAAIDDLAQAMQRGHCPACGYPDAHREPAPTESRYRPCGCIVCICDDEICCHGCGAKTCERHLYGKAAQPRGVDADSIRRARDREWCNRLEIQETLRPGDKDVDVHLAFLCRKMAGGVDAEKLGEARALIQVVLCGRSNLYVKDITRLGEAIALLEAALGEKR